MAEKLVKDPERLVATIEASFPYPDQMERYYGFDIQRFQIALPQHMAAELVSASEQQAVIEARQKAAQEAGQKIRSDVESFVADCAASLREQTAQLTKPPSKPGRRDCLFFVVSNKTGPSNSCSWGCHEENNRNHHRTFGGNPNRRRGIQRA
jgi:hypothetical protein